jgi:(p)ppGpp synthase/HD superfamily hydrolase
MAQLNIRITEEEKEIIAVIASTQGISSAELVKSAVFTLIKPQRLNIVFKLVEQGKIGRKKAWKLSGLSYREFLNEWTKREIQEQIPKKAWETGEKLALELNSKDFFKKTF